MKATQYERAPQRTQQPSTWREHLRASILIALVVLTAIGIAARNPRPPRKEKLNSVRGQVHVRGEPGGGVLLIFYRRELDGTWQRQAVLRTNDSGCYELRSPQHGLRAGEYCVCLEWVGAREEDEMSEDIALRLPPEASRFRVTVRNGINEFPPFELE